MQKNLSLLLRERFLHVAMAMPFWVGCQASTGVTPPADVTEPAAVRKSAVSRISADIRVIQSDAVTVKCSTLFTEAADCGIEFSYLNGATVKALMV